MVKRRYPLAQLRHHAEQLCARLAPCCERLAIAGSIRRQRSDPADIELVAVPHLAPVRDLFGALRTPTNRLWEQLALWREPAGPGGPPLLTDRKGADGKGAWGQRYVRALYAPQPGLSISLDLFMVLPPAQWGVIYALRTGPSDFNRLLVTPSAQGGALPAGRSVQGGQLWREGQPVPTPEEGHFFSALGLPYWSPGQRSGQQLTQHLRQHQAMTAAATTLTHAGRLGA